MIENAIYTTLKEITKDKADGVYLDFVNDSKIDKNKTYIVKCAFIQSGIYSCKYNELYGILLYVERKQLPL